MYPFTYFKNYLIRVTGRNSTEILFLIKVPNKAAFTNNLNL